MKIRHAISLTAAVPAMGASLVLGLATAHPAHACPEVTLTVDGTDYPQCSMEDCSDQPGQVGVWIDPDTGTHWLSIGETSYQVVR